MIGKTISHYKILEKLGEGGMGVVYKAEDTKLKRNVAIKFLPRQIAATEEERERFKIEARAAAALNHPNIATIHAIEELEDELFIVMEYIEGQELRHLIHIPPTTSSGQALNPSSKGDLKKFPLEGGARRSLTGGVLPLEDILDYATQIAEGLQAAHEKGVTHRDIKSSNIMITDKGRVKIMDFGLAKVRGGAEVTKIGTTLGTAAYMSPEQARGEEADHRSDIWSFGVVLYEMLTRQLPFRGDYEQAVIYSILNEEPARPENNSALPKPLEKIVAKCLAKSLSDRYTDMAALAEDLAQVEGAPSSPSSFSGRDSVPGQKRKVPLMWIGAAGLVVVLAIASVLFLGKEAESQERVPLAVVDFVNHTGEPELDALSGMLITALEQSRRLSVMSRSRMFDVLRQLGKGEVGFIDEELGKEICNQTGVQALVLPEIRKFGQAYSVDVKVLDSQKGEHLFARQVRDEGQEKIPDLIDQLAEQMRQELKEPKSEIQASSAKVAGVTTPNLEAYQHYFEGEEFIDKLDFARAKEAFRKAISLDSTFALAYYRLAYAMDWYSEQLASQPLQKAVQYIDRIPEKERYLVRAHQVLQEQGFAAGLPLLWEMETLYPNEKEMLFNIADWSLHSQDFATAVQYFDKVLELDPNHQRTHFHYGEALVRFYLQPNQLGSDYDAVLQKVLQARQRWPNIWQLIGDVANLLLYQGEYEQAEAEVLELLETTQADQARIEAQLWMSAILSYTGQYRRMANLLNQSIEASFAKADTATGVLGYVVHGYFHAHVTQDVDRLNQVITRLLTHMNRSDVPFIKEGIAGLYAGAGRISDALEILKKAPENPIAPVFMATWLGECENIERALKQMEDIPFIPAALKLQMLTGLAQCNYDEGSLWPAEQSLKKAQSIYVSLSAGLPLRFFRAIFYPRSLLLLGKIHEAREDTVMAIEYYELFLELWKKADPDLSDLIEAKRRLAALRG